MYIVTIIIIISLYCTAVSSIPIEQKTSGRWLSDSYYEPPGVVAGTGKTWKRIWDMSDEFWRPSLHSIWEPYNKDWPGRKPAYFKTENVRVYNHHLKLWSREESWESVPEELKKKGFHRFSTAFVRTSKLQKYGYFEIKAKMMDSEISSAFWLAHNEENRNDPNSWWTEIDVFEYSTSNLKPGYDQRYIYNTNIHVHRAKNFPYIKSPKEVHLSYDLSKSFHVYALDWTPHSITWYIDGKAVRKIPNKHFHRPMHLQLDSETFPKWFGLPKSGSKKVPGAFEIDYVRSWERVDV